jgi:hypothetical protein
LKFNKQLKVINPVPGFLSVPATSHVFDLAGSNLNYPNLKEEAQQFQARGFLSGFGSLFGFR